MNLRTPIRLMLVALLGAATALLVSCGSSGKGLIPASKAGPLQEDFEAVAQAASAGNGDCTATEKALGKTEQDFLALPVTIDAGLHKRLEEGIENLRKRALSACIQPTGGVTGTTSTTSTTNTTTTPTKTATTETSTTAITTPTTPSTPTTPTTTSPNTSGGTEAGGEHGEHGAGQEGNGLGKGEGKGVGKEEDGAGVGGASGPGGGQ
jgi:hypothetical protein